MIVSCTKSLRGAAVLACVGLAALIGGCPGATPVSEYTSPCDQPGVICTVAGTGRSLFDGDGRPALRTSLYFPLDVDFDSAGRPLILDWNNLRVRRINDDTSVQTIIGLDFEDAPVDGALAADTPLHHASDIEVDSLGRMYLAGYHFPGIFRLDLDDRVQVLAGSELYGNAGDGGSATQASLSSPYGVLPLDNGSFYFADIDAHVVRFVDSIGIINTVAGNGTRGYSGDNGLGTQAKLNGPTRLALDNEHNLYFCDTNNHVIRRLSADGIISTFAGTGEIGYSGDGGSAVSAKFNVPYDLRFVANGDLFIADTGNHVIRRIDPSGTVTTVVGTGVAGFSGDEGDARSCQLNGPAGVNFDAQGNLWISDTFNQRVRRVARLVSLAQE